MLKVLEKAEALLQPHKMTSTGYNHLLRFHRWTKNPAVPLFKLFFPVLSKHLYTDFFYSSRYFSTATNTKPVLSDQDLTFLGKNFEKIGKVQHPLLETVANYYLNAEGKKIRPLLVLLFGKALGEIDQRHYSLSMISELIHTASLLHDDVLDQSPTRRSLPTAHAQYGNKMSILAGDFLLARASMGLARLNNVQVVDVMATVLGELIEGEVLQDHHENGKCAYHWLDDMLLPPSEFFIGDKEVIPECFFPEIRAYLIKTYLKTASLLARSCQSSVLLHFPGTNQLELGPYFGTNLLPYVSEASKNSLLEKEPDLEDEENTNQKLSTKYQSMAFNYGLHLGMAFQLMDDHLDFTGDPKLLGKASEGSDLKNGIITGPCLFLGLHEPELFKNWSDCLMKPEEKNMSTDFYHLVKNEALQLNQSPEKTLERIKRNPEKSLLPTQQLAKWYADRAKRCIKDLKDSETKDVLVDLCDAAIHRQK